MFNGLLLKDLIEKKGMTQKQFSEKSGISEQSLYGLFRENANPTSKLLYKMAVTLQCSIDDLFDDVNGERPTIKIGHDIKGNGNKVGDISLSECQKEVEHLKAILEEKEAVIVEKERTIQILLNKL